MTTHAISFAHAPVEQWTAICLPDDPNKTLVRQDGALLYRYSGDIVGYQFWRGCFLRVLQFSIDSNRGCIGVAQTTESAAFPCVVTRKEYPHATLELQTFATRDDAGQRVDVVLWEIKPKSGVRDFEAVLRIEGDSMDQLFVASLDGTQVIALPRKNPRHVSNEDIAGGEAVAVNFPQRLATRATLDFRPALAVCTEPELLHAGDVLRGAVIVPLGAQDVSKYGYEWAVKALDRERAFWNQWAADHVHMRIPDPGIQDMITACARNIFQARDVKDGLAEFQVGATCYRGLWVVDGHFILEAAHYLGCVDEAQKGWDALLRRVRPDGSIAAMPMHLKETGISLATFVRLTELTNDWDRLRSIWPTVRNAVAYIRRLREEAAAKGEDAPEYGLLPVCFADGGLAGERAELTTTLWTLFGLREAVKAARILGMEEEPEFQEEFNKLMAGFRRAATKYQQRLPDGTPYVPMCLPGSGEHNWRPHVKGEVKPWDRINPGTATWAYAHAIYPGQILEPEDPLVQNLLRLLDSIDDEQDVPANTGWCPFQSVWTYSVSFYAHLWLYAGNPGKAIDYLYGFINLASPTRVWREEQGLSTYGHIRIQGDMPHNWASAELIRFVRALLIFERGDDLEFLYGFPQEWWPAPGNPLLLPESRTRFGRVSLEFRAEGEEMIIRVALMDPQWQTKPGEVRLRVPGTDKQVAVNGAPVTLGDDRVVKLRGDSTVVFGRSGSEE
jgi:hypothetical protein